MRLILLDGEIKVAEFGFLRLDRPTKAVSFEGEIYVLDHPMVAFGPDKAREVYGWVYRLEAPIKLRPQDALQADAEAYLQGGPVG